jgi:hypothetical protein
VQIESQHPEKTYQSWSATHTPLVQASARSTPHHTAFDVSNFDVSNFEVADFAFATPISFADAAAIGAS